MGASRGPDLGRDIDVRLELGVDVSYSVAWNARKKATNTLRGTPSDSYSKLPSYLYISDTTYPGSHKRLKKMEENEFLYVF